MFRALPLLLLPFSAHAFSIQELKTGDVLLESLPCYTCRMIELEEQSAYSHIGLVLETEDGARVMETRSSLHTLPLNDFTSIRSKGTNTRVLRPIDRDGSDLEFDSDEVSSLFASDYEGLGYDSDFLWDNFDQKGEKLYCAEFVAKFLNQFLSIEIKPKTMHYKTLREEWIKYFNGTPPDGKLGISPQDFLRSSLFRDLGELELQAKP